MPETETRNGRLAAITSAAATVPAAAWEVHPALGAVIVCLQTTAGITLIAAALFGSERLSERAFRLLRWITDSVEPCSTGTR
jgi:hypothetical protein